MITNKSNVHTEKIFNAKEQYHKDMAKLPFEEKIKIVVELQKIASSVTPDKKKKNIVVWKL